jgi:hypothetical protein
VAALGGTPGIALAADTQSPDSEGTHVDLPIREVTVYSDRARVQRKGTAKVPAGESRVRLPLLPPTLDSGSVRLLASGARVRLVEVKRADLDEFPRTEAEALLKKLESLHDQKTALGDQIESLASERQLLEEIRPTASPLPDPKGQPRLFEAGGWKAALEFLDARLKAVDTASRAAETKQREIDRDFSEVADRANQITGGGTANPGFKVDAVLQGKGGGVELTLVYVASNARWYPTYDVRFSPGRNQVQVDFGGLVAQETGEDWTDSRLVLSSAVPATTTALPKLLSWKIGEKDQFIPTPEAKPETPARPIALSPNPSPAPQAMTDAELRSALRSAASEANEPQDVRDVKRLLGDREGITIRTAGGRIFIDGTAYTNEDKDRVDQVVKRYPNVKSFVKFAANARKLAPTPRPPPPPPTPAPSVALAQPTQMEAEPPPAPQEVTVTGRERRIDRGASDYRGEVGQLESTQSVEEVLTLAPGSRTRSSSVPTEALAFAAPRGWALPSFAVDLPAAQTGGYDFSYPAARPESVRSGGEARRIALHSLEFPVAPFAVILPALRKQAYLAAEITNSSDRPLLKGTANLYVGADLQGQAVLETTAIGEKVTLPMGVDEAIRVERHVEVVTREKGIISKEDLTTYRVTIELMNPRTSVAHSRITDQIPLKGDQNVEVELLSTEPWAKQDKPEGTLEWDIDLQPGAKQTVAFTYSVQRPRGARLRQW